METQMENNEENSLSTIKTLRSQLESRIETQRAAQLDLLASLQSQIPDIVSSVDLSLKFVSSFNHRPFTPTPPLPDRKDAKKLLEISHPKPLVTKIQSNQNESGKKIDGKSGERLGLDENGSPLSVVRSMVAVYLIQRVPFTPIDSSTVLRKLENDQSVTTAEKAALREVGGESGAILAVEMALRSMAEENDGVELEEFVVSGKSRVMVLNIDRTRLLKELPEGKQYQELNSNGRDDNTQNLNQNQGQGQQGLDVNGGGAFGMARPMQDMWMGTPGDPHMHGPIMGPRGPGRGMGMMGMGRGMMLRPPLGPNAGPVPQQKPRTEEDDMKDLEALLNKKSFREMQKSKTGEELLDLIHRPTARETAVAAKVLETLGRVLLKSCFQ